MPNESVLEENYSKIPDFFTQSSAGSMRIISRGLFLLLRVCFTMLPPRVAVFCSRRFGRMLRHVFSREAGIATKQLEYFLKYTGSTASAEKLTTKVFGHIGEFVGESIIIETLLETKDTPQNKLPTFRYLSISGEDHLLKLKEQKQCCLVLTAHFGCFELLAACMIRCGFPVTTFARSPNYPFLGDFVSIFRERYGLGLLWRNDNSTSRALLKLLREANIIAALIDQDTNLENTFLPFFGLDAAFPSGIIDFAIKKQIPISTVFITRTKPLHHQIVYEPITGYEQGEEAQKIVISTYTKRLENVIRANPEQWLWWHRRWRRRPEIDYQLHPEQLISTADYLNWLSKKQESLSRKEHGE